MDCVIWSYEYHAWHQTENWGYAAPLTQAGHYSKDEAEKVAEYVGHAVVVPFPVAVQLNDDTQGDPARIEARLRT